MPDIRLRDRWADAINNGCVASCQRLLDEGVDVHDTNEDRGNPPLIYAASRGQYAICELLLNAGADVNRPNDYGSTGVHFATTALGTSLVKLFISRGANVNQRNDNGAVPLHWAATNGHAEACSGLAAAGAEIDVACITKASNGEGLTPLRHAVDVNSFAACKVLLDAGADPSIHGAHDGLTPFLAALKLGHSDIAKLLYDSGRVDPFYSTREGKAVVDYAGSPATKQLVLSLQTEYVIKGCEGSGSAGDGSAVEVKRSRGVDML
jgi:ankyrin repeat protein